MKVRNILGISGGKDSAALAIYLKQKYPNLKIEYYNSDTGCELAETELLIDRLSAYLGNIKRHKTTKNNIKKTNKTKRIHLLTNHFKIKNDIFDILRLKIQFS